MAPRAPRSPLEAQLLEELQAVYERADELYAGHDCPRSTECCRFALTRREPYVTSIEVAAIARALARAGGHLPAGPPPPRASRRGRDEGRCPLLDATGRCAFYAARPIGCRTHWCARASRPTPVQHRHVLALVRDIAAIAARHQPGGDAGRPLRRVLAELGRQTRR